MNSEQEQKLLESFEPARPRKMRRGVPHRVKIKGEFVQMKSGKHIWSNIGAAKNAVRNHLLTVFYNVPVMAKNHLLMVSQDDREKIMAEFVAKHIEYVPIL